MKTHEFDRIVSKFNLRTRDSGDRLAWLEYEGRVILRTKRSHGSGDLPMHHSIRQQLKLNENQLKGAIDCSFTLEDYLAHLRKRGLL
jgi:hypothetical protein